MKVPVRVASAIYMLCFLFSQGRMEVEIFINSMYICLCHDRFLWRRIEVDLIAYKLTGRCKL